MLLEFSKTREERNNQASDERKSRQVRKGEIAVIRLVTTKTLLLTSSR